jgi:hypothetical protein
VIGGVPREWRLGTGGSRPGYSDVYHAFDMLSPWMVGAIGTAADSDWMHDNMNVPDEADCAAHGIDYQPCVLPGDVSGRQRAHGEFMWRQFYNMIRAGAQGIYISMFDEFNEGNQIAKTAATAADAPAGFLTLDEDGTACSSDYYLRLTGDGGRMLKGEIALTPVRPTPPTVTAPSGDRAAGRPTSQSSQTQAYGSANVVDGSADTYWESANNAFPQWVQVDLGSAVAVTRLVLNLPPSWPSRVQTLSIVDGASGAVLVPSRSYTFANTVTITAPGTAVRYLRVLVTANTGWPAGQLSGLQAFG